MKGILAASVVVAMMAPTAMAEALPLVEVWKADSCGCCGEWVKHLEKNGFRVKVHRVDDPSPVRRMLGIPDRLGSCHTAKVDGYAVEGHVPASDIQRLLKDKPSAKGITAPGMPNGSPGMDIPNSPPYETYLVKAGGVAVKYARHEGPKAPAAHSLGCPVTADEAPAGCGGLTSKSR